MQYINECGKTFKKIIVYYCAVIEVVCSLPFRFVFLPALATMKSVALYRRRNNLADPYLVLTVVPKPLTVYKALYTV